MLPPRSSSDRRRRQFATKRFQKAPKVAHQCAKSSKIERLGAVAQRFVRMGVDLDEEAVGTGRNRCHRHRRHQAPNPRGVRWVDQDGEVRQSPHERHGGQVQSVSGGGLEGADPALAENDVGVAVGQDVLGAQQPFLDRIAQAALEENGSVRRSDRLQQGEVLGVASAHLQHVSDLGDVLDITGRQDLGDNRQPGDRSGLFEQIQARATESAKRIWRRPRLVRAAAQNGGATRANSACSFGHLVAAFDRAGPGGDDHSMVCADGKTSHHHRGGIGVPLPSHLLVRLTDGHRVHHAWKCDDRVADGPGIGAQHADRQPIRAGQLQRTVATFLDVAQDVVDLFPRGGNVHEDEHAVRLRRCGRVGAHGVVAPHNGFMQLTLTRLGDGDVGSLARLLDADPIGRVYLRSEMRLGSLTHGHWWGLGAGDDLHAVILGGPLVVPCLPDPVDAVVLGEALRRQTPARMMVGDRAAVMALHETTTPQRQAREIRCPQPLLVIRGLVPAPSVPVRRATPADLIAVSAAAAAMHQEEMGIDPLQVDASGWRTRMATLIDRGWSYLWTEAGEILFKTELSAWTPEAVQLQGVYTAPRWRGRGVATAALAAVCRDLLSRAGACSLYVNHYNTVARRLYDRLGFEEIGEMATIVY